MLPIQQIAEKLNIPNEYLIYYGQHMAKLKLELLSEWKSPNRAMGR